MSVPNPVVWTNDSLQLLDQRMLPHQEIFLDYGTIEGAYQGIYEMVVRGAPCIGFTGIFGMALWLKNQSTFDHVSWEKAATYLKSARPTAVNLMYEIDRVVAQTKAKFSSGSPARAVFDYVVADGNAQIAASENKNTEMAKTALEELQSKYGDRKLTLMTHCNTGFLACGTLGTALGVISYAHKKNKIEKVYADETRPYMQGTRLTAYELEKDGIPYEIVVEGAASYVLSQKKVDAIFVGADRITANGDTANKVGTATLAIVAKHYGVPFYVVAPLSSFDFNSKTGEEIHIEIRPEEEILSFKTQRVAPPRARALNPSFDVTPSSLITGIICEKGIVRNPTTQTMKQLLGGAI